MGGAQKWKRKQGCRTHVSTIILDKHRREEKGRRTTVWFRFCPILKYIAFIDILLKKAIPRFILTWWNADSGYGFGNETLYALNSYNNFDSHNK